MKATNFEFRQRVWLIMILFWAGFALYAVDRVNIIQWAVTLAFPGNGLWQGFFVRLILSVAALMVLLAAWLRTWAAAYLRSSVVHDPNLHSEAIVADGPYRYLRNPLYLGGNPSGRGSRAAGEPAGVRRHRRGAHNSLSAADRP